MPSVNVAVLMVFLLLHMVLVLTLTVKLIMKAQTIAALYLLHIISIYNIFTFEKRKEEEEEIIKHAGGLILISFSPSTGLHYLITLASATGTEPYSCFFFQSKRYSLIVHMIHKIFKYSLGIFFFKNMYKYFILKTLDQKTSFLLSTEKARKKYYMQLYDCGAPI